jgi:hypothetical protein
MKQILVSMLLVFAALSSAWADEPVTAQTILDEALANAQSVEPAAAQIDLLVGIAEAEIEVGNRRAAEGALGQAVAAAKTIAAADGRTLAAAVVMDAALELGDTTLVGDAASLGREQPDVMADVAAAEARAGDMAAASATLARALAALSSSTQSPEKLSIVTSRIAWAQAISGDAAASGENFKKALQTAALVGDWIPRRIVLMRVAEMQGDAGDHAGAARSLQDVLTTVATIPDADAGERDRAMVDISAMQAGIRLFAVAPSGGSGSVVALSEGERRALSATVTKALLSLGGSRRDAVAYGGGVTSGPEDLDAALDTALKIADAGRRFSALTLVVSSMLAAGDSAAQPALVEARNALAQIEADAAAANGGKASNPGGWEDLKLALLYVGAGYASQMAPAAKQMAQRGNPYLLACIAWALAEMGDRAAAKAALQDLLANPMGFFVPDVRETLRAYLAAFVEANIDDMAAALASAERIRSPRARAGLLIAIATRRPPPEYMDLMLAMAQASSSP